MGFRKGERGYSKKVWVIVAIIFFVVVSIVGYNYIKYKKEQSSLNSFELTYLNMKGKKFDEKEKNNLIVKLDEKFKKECEENSCKVREIYFYVSALQKLEVTRDKILQKEFLRNVMMEYYKNSFDIDNEISEDTFFILALMHRLEQFRATQADFWWLKLSNSRYDNLFDRFKQVYLLRILSNGLTSYQEIGNETHRNILKTNICTNIPGYKDILTVEQIKNADMDSLAAVYDYAYIKSFCKSDFNEEDKTLFERIANKDYPAVHSNIQKDIIINIGIKGLF